jgi:hypothetical protein
MKSNLRPQCQFRYNPGEGAAPREPHLTQDGRGTCRRPAADPAFSRDRMDLDPHAPREVASREPVICVTNVIQSAELEQLT